ncbi:MAG TPA: biotin--[acetyl-CoA-carboxylase] ligase [Acetobacteraceae bacterium]|nr:biotin--[acetyl-CoA-carboxylase] ligase [Acetobacteraceae bacterium]
MTAFDVRHYDRLGSTSDEARRLADAGAAHGTAVHADQQTAGRGRLSRRWFSPPGNLYLSIVLRLDLPPVRRVELGFIAALAVADAVEALLPRQVRATLKWPNDVLVRGGKIAGILVEQAGEALILGIGLNVLHAPDGVPYQVSTIVGCGGLATVDGTREKLLWALASWLAVWEEDGFGSIRAAWLARAHPPGSALGVRLADQFVTGQFAGIDMDGALLLDTEQGRGRIVAGDVELNVASPAILDASEPRSELGRGSRE